MTEPIPAAFRRAFPRSEPSAFARASADPEVSHGTLAAALDAAFAPVMAGAIGRPDRLAERLVVARGRDPIDQLRHVADVLATEAVVVDDADAGIEDLLLHRVRARGRGHELACIVLAIAAAERAGLDLDLVASPDMALLAHPELDDPVVLHPGRRWTLVDARTLGEPDLAWVCPHEAAAMWLRLVSERALVAGTRDVALRALDLELELPMVGPERQRLERLRATIRHGLS
jgi:hypothetical protein